MNEDTIAQRKAVAEDLEKLGRSDLAASLIDEKPDDQAAQQRPADAIGKTVAEIDAEAVSNALAEADIIDLKAEIADQWTTERGLLDGAA